MGNDYYDKILEVGTGSDIFLPELLKHCDMLEKHFAIRKRYIFPAIIGRLFPVYYYYKVGLKGLTCSKML